MQKHYAINIKPIKLDLKMGLQAEVKVHDMVALFSPFNTKLFGATGTHEPSKITIHEMHQLTTPMGNQTSPLCGLALENTSVEARLQMIRKEILFFSKYMVNQALTDRIKEN